MQILGDNLFIFDYYQLTTMGASSYTQTSETNELYMSDVKKLNRTNLLYQSRPSSSHSKAKLLKKKYTFTSSSQVMASYFQKLHSLGQYIESDNLMLPVYCHMHETKSMCSDERQIEIYHQIYEINIKEEILARKKHYEKFNETQVWYMLYSLVNACRVFQPHNIKSGNLKTNHVLLNKRGHLKIRNILTEPEIKAAVFANYFAPQELKSLRENERFQRNPNLCQTFSIAVIILQLCTFIEGQSLYDMYRIRINDIALQRALEQLEGSQYSKLLQELIKTMLGPYKDRPLPSHIYMAFRPYQSEIINLKPFKFDDKKITQSLYQSKVSIYSKY